MGAVTATLGDTVDLSSDEVVSILPVAKGSTGLSMPPLSGTILVGTGSGYAQALLSAGDGLTLIAGNCASLGIIGTGTTNYLAKFTGTGAIGNSLIFDDGTNVGISTAIPQSRLDVAGGAALGSYAGINAAPNNGLIVSGSVGIGTSSPVATLDISSTGFNLIQTTRLDSTGTSTWTQNLYSSSAFGPTFLTQMAKGTVASPQPLTINTHYLTIAGNGYNGAAFARGAHIYFSASETWSSTGRGTDIQFYNTANGSTSQLRNLVIKNNGMVGIGLGGTTPLSRLDINGGLAVGSYAGVNAAPTNGAIISGIVGIGTNNPNAPLDVYGTTYLNSGNLDISISRLVNRFQPLTATTLGFYSQSGVGNLTISNTTLQMTASSAYVRVAGGTGNIDLNA